jgi:hypothetical protein
MQTLLEPKKGEECTQFYRLPIDKRSRNEVESIHCPKTAYITNNCQKF